MQRGGGKASEPYSSIYALIAFFFWACVFLYLHDCKQSLTLKNTQWSHCTSISITSHIFWIVLLLYWFTDPKCGRKLNRSLFLTFQLRNKQCKLFLVTSLDSMRINAQVIHQEMHFCSSWAWLLQLAWTHSDSVWTQSWKWSISHLFQRTHSLSGWW